MSTIPLVTAMLEPGFYPNRPDRVELRETHASWVFLAGDLAYKVKKPIVLPFLDYGTVERRREMCRQEVLLNRRLAPGYYLGVDSVIGVRDGFRLVGGEQPDALEYTVRMRRVPEERTVESLEARGALTEHAIDAVGERIAAFHLATTQAPPGARVLVRLLKPFAENNTTLRDVGPPALPDSRLRAADEFTKAFLDARRGQIAARAEAGAVRDCHGDLRAEHVIVDGGVAIYDCIEFNPSLRMIDVGADVAFLVMDLARMGRPELGVRLLDAYRSGGGDPGDDALVHFYASYRAWVRAKVACLRAAELPEGAIEREESERNARALLALGHRLAWRARQSMVVTICGVAASGKSALASRLAEVSGLQHLSSDVTRKRLAGLEPTDRAGPEVYSEEFTLRTYEELGRLARAELDRSGGVIVDATFHLAVERGAYATGLGEGAPGVVFAECRAPLETLLARARARAGRPSVSDAGPDVVHRQLREWQPLDEIPAHDRIAVEAGGSIHEEVVDVEGLTNRHLVRCEGCAES